MIRVVTSAEASRERGADPELIIVQPRIHGIKMEGLDDRGQKYSAGVSYGQVVTCAAPA